MLTFVVSLIVSLFLANPASPHEVVPWLESSDGKIHVQCVDFGPTWCLDGATFNDNQPDDMPVVIDRANQP